MGLTHRKEPNLRVRLTRYRIVENSCRSTDGLGGGRGSAGSSYSQNNRVLLKYSGKCV